MPPPSPGGIPTRLSLPSASRTARQQPRNTHVSSGIFVWALAQGGMQSSPSIITIHGTAQGPILQAPAISKRSCRRHAGAARGSCCPGGAPPRPRPCRSPGSAVREGPSPGSTAAASAPGAPLRPPGAVGAVRPRAPNRGQLRPGEHPGVRSGSQPRPGVRTQGCGALRAPARGAHPRAASAPSPERPRQDGAPGWELQRLRNPLPALNPLGKQQQPQI